jgi:hypothetical protein
MATQLKTPATTTREERTYSRPALRIHARRAIPAREGAAATPAVATRTATDVTVVALSLVIGYQWLVSGVDKVLYGGAFAGQVQTILHATAANERIPGVFRGLLSSLLLPHSDVFALLAMWGETLAGAGLLIAGVVYLLRPYLDRAVPTHLRAAYGVALRALTVLAPLAAAATVVMGLTYFLMDGLPTPFFQPSVAAGGAIDAPLFLAMAAVALLVGQIRMARRAR